MKQEIWKDIEGFSRYQVSNIGRVKSKAYKSIVNRVVNGKPQRYEVLRNNLIRNPTFDSWGYLQSNFIDDNGICKSIKIHKLVALCFIGEKPSDSHQIHHIDENKVNNVVENLEWVTQSENMRRNDLHIRKGISSRNNNLSKPVAMYDLDMNLIREFPSVSEASRVLAERVTNIIRVCKGERKSLRGFKWKYKGVL